jgi:hypothetical protein
MIVDAISHSSVVVFDSSLEFETSRLVVRVSAAEDGDKSQSQ